MGRFGFEKGLSVGVCAMHGILRTELAPWPMLPSPMVCGAMAEAMQPSSESCAPARGERTCCSTEVTRDVRRSAGVGKVECTGENLCMYVSEWMRILPVHVQG